MKSITTLLFSIACFIHVTQGKDNKSSLLIQNLFLFIFIGYKGYYWDYLVDSIPDNAYSISENNEVYYLAQGLVANGNYTDYALLTNKLIAGETSIQIGYVPDVQTIDKGLKVNTSILHIFLLIKFCFINY